MQGAFRQYEFNQSASGGKKDTWKSAMKYYQFFLLEKKSLKMGQNLDLFHHFFLHLSQYEILLFEEKPIELPISPTYITTSEK